MAKIKKTENNLLFKVDSKNFESSFATHNTGFFVIDFIIKKDIGVTIEKIYFEGIPAKMTVKPNVVSGNIVVMLSNKLLTVAVFASGHIGEKWEMDFKIAPSSKIYTPKPSGEVKSSGKADFKNIYSV